MWKPWWNWADLLARLNRRLRRHNKAPHRKCQRRMMLENLEVRKYLSGTGKVPAVIEVQPLIVTAGDVGYFTPVLNHAVKDTVTINYAVADGTAIVNADYFLPPTGTQTGTIVIKRGETVGTPVPIFTYAGLDGSASKSFTISLNDPTTWWIPFSAAQVTCTIVEPAASTTPPGGNAGTQGPATNSVGNGTNSSDTRGLLGDADDSTSPSLTVSVSGPATAVDEGDSATFEITRSGQCDSALLVSYETENGTAWAGVNYYSKSGTVTIPAGSATATVDVTTIDDHVYEQNDEYFKLDLTGVSASPSGSVAAALGSPTEASAYIRNIDPGSVTISPAQTADEGATAYFQVTLGDESNSTISVCYQTQDGSAKAGTNYVGSPGWVTIPAWDTTATIPVPTIDDHIYEANDMYFWVELTGTRGGGSVGWPCEASAAIHNIDAAPSATISGPGSAVNAGDTASFNVTLSCQSNSPIIVGFETHDDTARAGTNYDYESGDVTISPGYASATIAVPTTDYHVYEANDLYFYTKLTSVSDGGSVGWPCEASAAIHNIDQPSVSIGNASVMNGTGVSASFTVSLSGAESSPVTVTYSTADGASAPDAGYGAAKAGVDYVAQSATVTIAASATSAVIKIPIIAATVAEPNEDFFVNLTGATSAALGQTQGTGWITNNLPWFVNSTGDLAVRDPSASPWTGQDNVNGDPECTLYSDIQYLDATGGQGSALPRPERSISRSPKRTAAIPGGSIQSKPPGCRCLTQSITVDGSSQPGYSGTPNVNVVGEGGGFSVSAGPSTIEALAITGSGGIGISIGDPAGHDKVQDCYIGVEPDGKSAGGNIGYGVEINNSPQNTIQHNVISANSLGGIHITGSDAQSNSIQIDNIGTDAGGTAALFGVGSQDVGVLIDGGAQLNTVGGAASGVGNVISANAGSGVTIDGALTNSNTVAGNWIGTDEDGSAEIGNGGDGVSITNLAQSNTIGGCGAGAGNVISANAGNGVTIDGGLTNSNTVAGNWIGTDEDGSAEIGNGGDGVIITNLAQYNTIGGSGAGAGNVISGNWGDGVAIDGSNTNGNTVAGNWIGTDENNSTEIGNCGDGVLIDQGAQSNRIGGYTVSGASPANVISGNWGNGITIDGFGTDANFVQGNYIGTNSDGTAPIRNDGDGVAVTGSARSNTIGGDDGLDAGNVISGNGGNGVTIDGYNTNANKVWGNCIGTDDQSSTEIGNGGDGVSITGGARLNDVGGTALPGGGERHRDKQRQWRDDRWFQYRVQLRHDRVQHHRRQLDRD